ncbi:MAG: GntR family transcriptional regulator [Lawsonibacter sp.]|jgi:DNA-binding GntR family transcriptional regulator|nr:GntR family transcriptional regulator [Lawsonibacter sp.]MCI9268913.1 GntR family transcriptional regulator [Lawsonibacter sp.]
MRLSERMPRESGRDYALRNIKANIVNLELVPGSQISENELAVEMGLSRTPVREALIELSKVEIIESHPQRKSTVSLIDYDLVEESRFMRNLLECAVVELVCEMAGPMDVERLNANIRLQSFYLDGTYTNELMALDNQFHGMLFEIAKKSRVFELIQNIAIHFDRVRGMALSSVKDLKVVQDHQELVEFIRQRDAKAARELMEVHLNRYKIDAAEIRETYPQYFK